MFEHLVGNDHVKEIALRLIRKGRLPNSLLFAGPDGVGKRQFAFEIARALVCVQPKGSEACGSCSACRRADQIDVPKSDKGEDFDRVFFAQHQDVGMVVPFRRNLRIDAIRALEREANFAPFEASSRVFIIDDADKMTGPASNALLKTLEEPPPSSHIFLVTSRPDSLLPTILSRCQTLRFAPVRSSEIERYLIDSRGFITEEATLASRMAHGSIGRAVSCDLGQFRDRRDKMFEVLRCAISDGSVASMLRVSDEMNEARNKEGFEDFLEILESLIHDVWTLRISGNAARLVNADLTDRLTGLARDAGNADLAAWSAEIGSIRRDLAVNINKKVAADALFVSMAGI